MKKLLLTSIVSISIINCFAKNTITVVHDTLRITSDAKELELYKMLYQNAKDNSSVNYTMLYTIIAIVVAFILFIVGSQVFFNYRLNKRDLDNLRSELMLQLTTEISTLKSSQQSLEIKLINDINEKISNTNNKIESVETRLSKSVNLLHSAVHELRAESYKSLGWTQLSIANRLWQCRYDLKENMDQQLKLTLESIMELLSSVDEIYDISVNAFNEINGGIREKYADKFVDLLDKIKLSIESKKIIKLQ
jgi:hypothetical protein